MESGYYTVKFDSKGGRKVDSQKVKEGETADRPTNPIRQGYFFLDWLDENKNEFDFSTEITSDITLEALWGITLKRGDDIYIMFTNYTEATSFKKADAAPESASKYLDEGKIIPVWYDSESKTIFYYVEDGVKVFLNENAGTMFYQCKSLINIDLSGFDTSNATDMGSMFLGCEALTELDLSNFDTKKVTDMQGMFYGCKSLKSLDLSNFDTSKVQNIGYMFFECSSITNIDLSNFDTSEVTFAKQMFGKCNELTTIYSKTDWNTEKFDNYDSLFYSCKKLKGGNGTIYDSSNDEKTYARLDGGPDSETPGYFTKKLSY